jgi:hypothetical protein
MTGKKEEHIIGLGSVIFIGLCLLLLILVNDKSNHWDNSPGFQSQKSVSLISETIIAKIDFDKIITSSSDNYSFPSYAHSKVEIYDQKINQRFSSASQIKLRIKPFLLIRSCHHRPVLSIEDLPVLS